MNFKSILRCNHDLKKNGYKIIRKLHKLEMKKNTESAYLKKCKEGYFFVLSYKNLFSIIKNQYGNDEKISREFNAFEKKSNLFLSHLESISRNKAQINKRILASYLTAYTNFFNLIICYKVPFFVTQEMLIEWNQKCLMAYYAAWSK